MIQVQRFNKALKSAVIIGDLVILDVLFVLQYILWTTCLEQKVSDGTLPQILVLFSLCYFACTISRGIILHRRGVRADQVVQHNLLNMFYFILLSMTTFTLADFGQYSHPFFILFYLLFTLCLICYRLAFRSCLKIYRKRGGNSRTAVYMGSTENMTELYHEMTNDPTSGYRVIGYFDSVPNENFPVSCPYLGKPEETIDYLKQHRVEQLYCSLPSSMGNCILPVINYCENNLVHFYSVPNMRNYLHHRMSFGLIGSVPILRLHEEPLSSFENRLIKRTFDFFFSLLFLCTLFPVIFLIVSAVIKITSPGPIFFKQRTERQRILVLQIPFDESEQRCGQDTGYAKRPPQDKVRQLYAQDQH